jgi:transcription elongation factor Elf1
MPKTEIKGSSKPNEDYDKQALLSKFLNGDIKTLEPTYDPNTGYHYPAVEAVVGDAGKAQSLLDKLTEEKTLEEKLFDKVIYCPHCGSSGISFRYCCPFCKSFNIKKSSLIEHVKCGYMDLEENFRKGSKMICPKCHEELLKMDVDYRKAGMWCACKDCGKNFDIPVPEHYCTHCHSTSNFEQATIKDVYSYALSANAKEKMSSDMFLVAPTRDLLIKEGFQVESPAYLTGKSGAKHSFNLAAYSQDKTKIIVVDLAMSDGGLVSEQPVIALFAKTFDVSPTKAFLLAIPKLNDNARKMAELYSIKAIDASSQAEAVAALKQKLEN